MSTCIIIEGPDNIGKTSLINHIAQKFIRGPKLGFQNVEIKHFGPPRSSTPAEQIKEQMIVLEKGTNLLAAPAPHTLYLFDRSPIGELVYGALYRSYDQTPYKKAIKKWALLNSVRFFIIGLYADHLTYRKFGIKAKGDETVTYQKSSESKRISVGFINAISWLNIPTTLLVNCNNYESLNQRNEYILNRFAMVIQGEKYWHYQTNDYTHSFFRPGQRLWSEQGFVDPTVNCPMFKTCAIGKDHVAHSQFGEQYEQPTNGCGAVTNSVKYIFVGEAPGYNGCGKLGLPFYDDRSGNLLQTALDYWDVLPTQYYMTNVVKCTPKDNKLDQYGETKVLMNELWCASEQLKAELTKFPQAKIIALGRTAEKALGLLGIRAKFVYHPAYYVRKGEHAQFIIELGKVL